MTFRIYLRGPDQSVSSKTVTGDPVAALTAFRTLTDRTDLDGTAMLAVLNENGRPVAHHRFDGLDPAKWWRGRTIDIILSKAG
jgi:hypothetical protein